MGTSITARIERLEALAKDTEPLLPVRVFIETEFGVPVDRCWSAEELSVAGYATDPQIAIQIVDCSAHHSAGEGLTV